MRARLLVGVLGLLLAGCSNWSSRPAQREGAGFDSRGGNTSGTAAPGTDKLNNGVSTSPVPTQKGGTPGGG